MKGVNSRCVARLVPFDNNLNILQQQDPKLR